MIIDVFGNIYKGEEVIFCKEYGFGYIMFMSFIF